MVPRMVGRKAGTTNAAHGQSYRLVQSLGDFASTLTGRHDTARMPAARSGGWLVASWDDSPQSLSLQPGTGK